MGKRVRILDEEPTIQGGNIFPVDLNTYQEVRRVTLDQIKNYVNSNVSGTSGSSGSSGVDGNFYGSSGSSGSGLHGSSGISPTANFSTDPVFFYLTGNTTLYVPYIVSSGVTVYGINLMGSSGSSGTSGQNGSSGTSGTSGTAGSSGTSGKGTSGSSGTSAFGSSGTSASSGTAGTSTNFYISSQLSYDTGTTTLYTPNASISSYYYIGDTTSDNSWRFTISGNTDLIFQRKISGNWVTKSTINGV